MRNKDGQPLGCVSALFSIKMTYLSFYNHLFIICHKEFLVYVPILNIHYITFFLQTNVINFTNS